MSGYYNTFVVRLWCDEAGDPVKGRIEHTSTQEQAYFTKLEDMNEFIRKHPGKPSNGLNGARKVIVVEKKDKPVVKPDLKSKQRK